MRKRNSRRHRETQGGYVHFVVTRLRHQRTAFISLCALTLVVAFAASGAPRMDSALLDGDIRATVSSASASFRDPVATVSSPSIAGQDSSSDVTSTWGRLPGLLHDLQRHLAPELRRVLDQGHFAGSTAGPSTVGANSRLGFPAIDAKTDVAGDYRIQASPDLTRSSKLIRGKWPVSDTSISPNVPLEVVSTALTAERMGWRVGASQMLGNGPNGPFAVKLVGLVRPDVKRSDFWSLDSNRLHPSQTQLVDGTPLRHGTVFIPSQAWPSVADALGGASTTIWFDVLPNRFEASRASAVQRGLAVLLSQASSVDAAAGDARAVAFGSFLPEVLSLFEARSKASRAVLSVAVSGPIGLAIFGLVFGVVALVDGQKTDRRVLKQRGASMAWLACDGATTAAVATVPGALLGATFAALIPSNDIGGWVLTVVIAMVAPPAFAATLVLAARTPGKFGSEAMARLRLAAEALVLLVAAGTIITTVQHVASRHSTSLRDVALSSVPSVDPVVSLGPLLVAFAVVTVLVRVRPLVTIAFVTLVRSNGLSSFLGSASDARDRSGSWTVGPMVVASTYGILAVTVLASASTVELHSSHHAQGLDTRPLVAGLGTAVIGGILLSAVMVFATTASAALATKSDRQRRASVFRLLGFSAAQRRLVDVWALMPRTLGGVLVGSATGLALSFLVVPAVLPPATNGDALDIPLSLVIAAGALYASCGAGGTWLALAGKTRDAVPAYRRIDR